MDCGGWILSHQCPPPPLWCADAMTILGQKVRIRVQTQVNSEYCSCILAWCSPGVSVSPPPRYCTPPVPGHVWCERDSLPPPPQIPAFGVQGTSMQFFTQHPHLMYQTLQLKVSGGQVPHPPPLSLWTTRVWCAGLAGVIPHPTSTPHSRPSPFRALSRFRVIVFMELRPCAG